ncbi:MAG: SDR family oxidoreductase [Candidatus Portnoybacteria bacterium]|nr:SDR family oxidoreductase [Candidatus Portnoybacteria bacterium]MDD4982519.1 SDR family oxidoreductase [Candidatus Portnoybacteria bacterium]
MKILVTGGAGFIGSNLCEYLLKRGDEVICFDNFFSGSKGNIKHLSADKKFMLVKGDVEKPYFFKVNGIYNLACPASPIWYQKNPIKTVETNILGALSSLNLAEKLDCRILQASTSEVYGDPVIHPQPESYWGNVNPIGPRSCYDEGKRCAETLFFDHRRERGVKIKVARIFNTYGPGMAADDGRVVSNFIVQALREQDITIYGDGGQTRSFCYIEDMIRGLVLLMESPDAFAGPVNIGNPEEFTIKELAEKIIELTGSKSKITYKPLPQDDPKQRQPDISLARQELGWQPKIELEEGISKTIEYFSKIVKRKSLKK